MDQFAQFTNASIDEEIEETPVTAAETAKKEEKKAEQKALETAFMAKVKSDDAYAAAIRTRSKDLEVVKSLGFGDSGSLVVDKAQPFKLDEHGNKILSKKSTPDKPRYVRNYLMEAKIVGYVIKNVSDQPIPYTTVQATKGADGVWTETVVDKVLAPHTEAAIPKKYLTALAARPEFSLVFANGTMKKSSTKTPVGTDTLDEALEAFHFSAGKEGTPVNSDEFKINISVPETTADGTKVWKVKPEFEATFGIYNNAEVKKTAAPKAKKNGKSFTSTDVSAFYIQSLMAQKKG